MPAIPTRSNSIAHRVVLALGICAVVTAGIITSACTADTLPDTVAGISGTATSVETRPDGTGTMLVEGPEQPEGAVSDRAQVTVNEDTRYFDAEGQPLSERPRIVVGAEVRVWFTGPVAESYPVQGTASDVQLVR